MNGDHKSTYAIKDIKKGEEIVEDYSTYEWPKWFLKILDQYEIKHDFNKRDLKARQKNGSGGKVVKIVSWSVNLKI